MKTAVYQAFVLKNTKIETFMNRGENLKLFVLKMRKDEESIKTDR
jgi:hypothetical protein